MCPGHCGRGTIIERPVPGSGCSILAGGWLANGEVFSSMYAHLYCGEAP